MKITVAQICKATGGRLLAGKIEAEVTGVAIDSRQVKAKDLFVAFTGERTEGHNYLNHCAALGAAAALVEQEVDLPPGLAVIRVSSTLYAIQELARWYRTLFPGVKVVGITGSSGKTTTKELTAAALSGGFTLLKSQGNQNNELGLPLTMFALREDIQVAVLEMGMSDLGEIGRLCEIASPDIGIITNIGEAHMERLGSKESILRAKYELAEGLKPGGTLIYNGDDPFLIRRVKEEIRDIQLIPCGLSAKNLFRATDILADAQGSSYTLHWQGGIQAIELQVPGRHNVGNSLLAFAAAAVLGVEPILAAQGLETTRGEKGRMDVSEIYGMTVIDDAYNANPSSMRAALEYLASLLAPRRIAFLGDMLELGDFSVAAHRDLGTLAAQLGVDIVIAVGHFAGDVTQGALQGGMSPEQVLSFPSSQDASQALDLLQPGDVVLLKGSRGLKMEVILEFFKHGGSN
jgi:UDP-N-acetylmuramoyl-tripeptide--D-alanyl-D-alanine ligase